MSKEEAHTPWATPPSGQGEHECTWCLRAIYMPALPCSIEPIEGLLRMETSAGQGNRCKYELGTRHPEMLAVPLGL
jgi:hypothetical protein